MGHPISVYGAIRYLIASSFLGDMVLKAQSSNSFDQARSATTLANVQDIMAQPWSPIGSVAAAASSYYTGNETAKVTVRDAMWIVMKPLQEDPSIIAIDNLFAGFEDGGFDAYVRDLENRRRPLSYYFVNSSSGNLCLDIFNNLTDSIRGTTLGPPNIKISNFDARNRPWYLDSAATINNVAILDGSRFGTYGAIWTKPYISVDVQMLKLTAARQLRNSENKFIGVVAADFEMNILSNALSSLAGDGSIFTVFIVDNTGHMITASISGVSVSSDGKEQVQATQCSTEVISAVALTIENEQGGWYAVDGLVSFVRAPTKGLHWFQSNSVQDGYGLDWHVVVIERVRCSAGYFVSAKGSTECLPCPHGAVCLGGLYSPFPQNGYWTDRTRIATFGKMFSCRLNTCLGFQPKDLQITMTTVTNDASSISYDDATQPSLLHCWDEPMNRNISVRGCGTSFLLCAEGSFGPMCGSCADGYFLDSAQRICVDCRNSRDVFSSQLASAIILLILGAYFILFRPRQSAPESSDNDCFRELSRCIVRMATLLDRGSIKVIYTTMQILSSAATNLNMSFPEPFRSFTRFLAFTRLEFTAIGCFSGNVTYSQLCVIGSVVPIAIISIDFLVFIYRVYCLRRANRTGVMKSINYLDEHSQRISREHITFAVILSYVVLPTISSIQFFGLDCVAIGEIKYLRVDTSQRCDSKHYQTFVALDLMFIAIYQSVPLVWFLLLWKVRERLNQNVPENDSITSNAENIPRLSQGAFDYRNSDTSIEHLSFLFKDYKPAYWFYEVVDMYRRVILIAVLPLIGSNDVALQATAACLFSLIFIVVSSELSPFRRDITNFFNIVAQYQIFLTFFSAVVLASEILKSLAMHGTTVGIVLIMVNIAVIGLAILVLIQRWKSERELEKWRRKLSDDEIKKISNLMNGITASDNGVSSHPADEAVIMMLKQYTIKPADVKILQRVGSGAYGEVFKGTCLGSAVAIKTMLDVSDQNVLNFRAEIILTAALRHPNIIQFVGACWDRELIALVLEWAPRGSLGTLIEKSRKQLKWTEPLLRMCTDIARGMNYLHGRRFFDEASGIWKECILHRDLKPDNCLLSEFLSVKIADFGASRSKAAEEVTMTSVGTPLFSAPEVMRGESYDESADVYSFGMTLLAISVEVPLLVFIGNQWCTDFKKKKAPRQPLRLVRAMSEDLWRPLSRPNQLEYAPSLISDLIVRCCVHCPSDRPSFQEILDDLQGPCNVEIESSVYIQKQDASRPSTMLRESSTPLHTIDNNQDDIELTHADTYASTLWRLSKALTDGSDHSSISGRSNSILTWRNSALAAAQKRPNETMSAEISTQQDAV